MLYRVHGTITVEVDRLVNADSQAAARMIAVMQAKNFQPIADTDLEIDPA